VALMATPAEFTGPVNLGNPVEFRIIELAEKIIAITGSRSVIVKGPMPADDPVQRQPDTGLARKNLGWEPKVQLDAGLKKTIEYFEAMLDPTGTPAS
jgi:UDP-glucuronate decarboxylase